ncbi:DUF1579 domain-containing protein [Chitinolyticbacter meiyuanensis]|uniref:DUF1579 domain-containing protein n=1 Tax=Chitinolyticbacter meiyuanensis TaxID=682798 RepID=UPI0011E5E235|nr:DUF1579 domain-containing protein [Chitinolyticbacter meiyuanensis]
MKTDPAQQHRWLQKLLGEWTYVSEADMGPDQPPYKGEGSESVRGLGELWVLLEGEGKMPDGTPGTMLMTLGYNPETNRFVGSWVGSMMTHLWVYDGELNDAGTVLTLSATGPDFEHPGQTRHYHDVIELLSDSERLLYSEIENPDGSWTRFMESRYTRR